MSVSKQHPYYEKVSAKWKRCRDVMSGQDEVHKAGTLYLPQLKSQSDEDYKAYLTRTPFFNASWRTVAGLTGMIFRKTPRLEIPASVEPLLATITREGVPLEIFARHVVEEALITGRVGVLVDYPQVENPDAATQADAIALNLRPTLAMYETEAIVNWKTEVIKNKVWLVQVVLKENQTLVGETEFDTVTQTVYRVLDLTEKGYRVRLFQVKDNQDIQIGDDLFPRMAGKPMSFIPFYPISTDEMEISPDEPPLIDLVDLNLSHFRTSADYEHGCHFTALPTGYITGHTLDQGEKIYLGSQSMLIFPNPDATVGFLEFQGLGLNTLKENLERKESQMAILGARMLEVQKKGIEAAETASIHRAGETSLLSSIAKAISLGLTAALQTFGEWAGGNGETVYELNTDFMPAKLDAQSLTALVGSWQQGAISQETLFYNLKKGQIISDEVGFEDELTRIQNTLR